jgi:Rho GDP-dissociation inhibitor
MFPPTILCIGLHGLQLTVLTLELHSPSLPTPLVFNMDDVAKMADIKKNPITIKEGVDYTCVC